MLFSIVQLLFYCILYPTAARLYCFCDFQMEKVIFFSVLDVNKIVKRNGINHNVIHHFTIKELMEVYYCDSNFIPF